MAFSYTDSSMLFWVCRKHLLMLENLGHFVSCTGFLLDWIFYSSYFECRLEGINSINKYQIKSARSWQSGDDNYEVSVCVYWLKVCPPVR